MPGGLISVLFVDSNIPIYARGRSHRLKDSCGRILDLVVAAPNAFVTSSEVLQELLHFLLTARLGIDRFEDFVALMQGRIEPVHALDIERAAALSSQYPGIEARDLVHAGVMERIGVQYIVSADRRLSRIGGLTRLDPADVDTWSRQIEF